MDKTTPLSNRLLSVCSFVPSGYTVADIGTDHARVPIWLIQKGIIDTAIASDIGKGPLDKARENINYYGLTDKIELRLGNGMETLSPGDADCIIIAGMGGELMSNLIKTYIPQGTKRLILQPMTDSYFIRDALTSCGYKITSEDLIYENDKFYSVIVCEPGVSKLTQEETFLSPFMKIHPLYKEYLLYKTSRMEKAAKMAEKAGAETGVLYEYNLYKKELE